MTTVAVLETVEHIEFQPFSILLGPETQEDMTYFSMRPKSEFKP